MAKEQQKIVKEEPIVSKFQFRDDDEWYEYKVWEQEGKYETVCERCKKKIEHTVEGAKSKKQRNRIEAAIQDPDNFLLNEKCFDCYKVEQEIERGLESDEKRVYNPNAPRIGQAVGKAIDIALALGDIKWNLSRGELHWPKEKLDEYYEKVLEFSDEKQNG